MAATLKLYYVIIGKLRLYFWLFQHLDSFHRIITLTLTEILSISGVTNNQGVQITTPKVLPFVVLLEQLTASYYKK